MEILVREPSKYDYNGLILPASPEYTSRPGGTLIVDGMDTAQTQMCCHCGTHWTLVKGSGKRRGWCLECSGLTCGKPSCTSCYPYEKQIDDMSKRGWRVR